MKEKYITDDEKEKCRKVADAFAELYEIENILVVDAGRYGFVKLFDTQLFLLAKGTPMAGMGYSEIFECLPKEKQKELTDRKAEFARVAGIE